MPCFTQSRAQVKLEKTKLEKMQTDLLVQAMSNLKLAPRLQGDRIYFGNNESYNINTGEMLAKPLRDINEIKRAYSAEIVKSQAERYGWTLVETAPFEFELTKQS